MKSLKTVILIAVTGMLSYSAMAQKGANVVPQAVQTAFAAKYPVAQIKKWKTKNNTSTAIFVMDNKKYTAQYSNNGDWLVTERTIKHSSNLPANIRTYLKKSSYASWYIDDMERVRTPMRNMYQVEVDNNSGNKMIYEGVGSFEDKKLCFNDEGRLIETINN
jgi:hypothetical protein